jgi:hypothetical protein
MALSRNMTHMSRLPAQQESAFATSEMMRPTGRGAYAPPGAWLQGRLDLLTHSQQQRWLLVLLLVGVAARCVRYLLCFPLWEDECFLCVNLLDRSYAELAGPLQYHQVAPLWFLWVQRTVIHVLGFSEWSLRLFPLVCSLASVGLFVYVARRMLQGAGLLLAVGIFAVAYPGVRYAAEAKPYGSDLCVALVLLALAVRWWQTPQQSRWLWGLCAAVPWCVGLSYPAVFVAAAVSLLVLYVLWNSRRPGRVSAATSADVPEAAATDATRQPPRIGPAAWWAWLLFNGLVLASFAALYAVSAARQSEAELHWMRDYWQASFPPLADPVALVAWLLKVHAGDLLAYPAGGGRGASSGTLVCFAAGVAFLIARRQGAWLLLLLVPLGVNLVAAALQRYPYGGHVKFAQYAAPAICLLAGLGAAVLLSLRRQAVAWSRRLVVGAAAALVLLGGATMARDFVWPYKSRTDQQARDFARWFWPTAQFAGEVACLHSDLGCRIAPQAFSELSWSAMYLCNQRIYSPRHAAQRPIAWQRVSARTPLRCVLYRAPAFPHDEAALRAWLDQMQQAYRLSGRERYPFPCYGKRDDLRNVDYIEVFTFVPRDGDAAARHARHAAPRQAR